MADALSHWAVPEGVLAGVVKGLLRVAGAVPWADVGSWDGVDGQSP